MSWELLSQASSQSEHTCTAHDKAGCRGCRWFEVALTRMPSETGGRMKYGVVIKGMSLLPGETDRIRQETSTSPHAIVDFLALGAPDRRYIPKVSRKALHEAADIDDALADALDDFDTVASSRP
jgi:hypothetical protein